MWALTWLSRNGKRVKSESRKHRKRRRGQGDEHKQRREEPRQSTKRHSRAFSCVFFGALWLDAGEGCENMRTPAPACSLARALRALAGGLSKERLGRLALLKKKRRKQRREEPRQSTTRHSREFLVRLFRSFLARCRGRLRKHASSSASL